MALGRALDNRVRRLESLPRVVSTVDKWSRIHKTALRSLSEEDQRTWNATQADDNGQEFAKDIGAVADRYNEAFVDAFTTTGRFTIAELDDVLAAG